MTDLDLAALRDIADPLRRAAAAHRAVPAIEEIRDAALAEARQDGMSFAAIGAAVDLTGERVRQILKGKPGPERAFWGADSGHLTVAVAEKKEAAKLHGRAGETVASEDVAAFAALSAQAAALGLATEHEVIQEPGFVDLNRSGLVVICGPRMSPMIRQILAGDRVLGFACDDDGWYLRNYRTGHAWRSPEDSGEQGDVAYLGRLPRPDGQGMFVYIAGIHAVGAPGAVHYLGEHLAETWQAVRDRRFSTLISCTYTQVPGKGKKITSSERVTDWYEGGQ